MRVTRFWMPLAATWLMMAAEGPFVAAVIARLPEPALNLAAFGVALSFAMFIEGPVIMLMSASTALVRDASSLVALRRFTLLLDAGVTVAMLVLLAPPVFDAIATGLIGLPGPVAARAHMATAVFLPWPAAIGYRRFFQGVLIRHGLTRRVAYGTIARLSTMAAVGLGLALSGRVPGAVVGAAALSCGVVIEALATRVMAGPAVRALRSGPRGEGLETGRIVRFYTPLALTTLLTLGAHPLVTFFLGGSRRAVDSLAVLPVVITLVFLLRAPALAFQEVVITLDAPGAARASLRRFGRRLAVALSGALALLAFTPAAPVWLREVAGLSDQLATLALWPLRILAPMPALEVALSTLRARLVVADATRPVTVGTAIEVTVLASALALLTGPLGLVGIVAGSIALLLARSIAVGVLALAANRVARDRSIGSASI